MGRIKVLHMPIANARGGVTQYALNILRHIDSKRFSLDFATRSQTLDFEDSLRAMGSTAHRLSCSSMENEARFIADMNAILDIGYDVVHLHTCHWNGFWAERLAMEHKCPKVIVHAHNSYVDRADAAEREKTIQEHEQLKREFSLNFATNFWACSRVAADWLFGPQIPREKIRILKNAVNIDMYAFKPATRDRVRRELGLDGRLVLGCIGRFAYQKNQEFLLEAFAGIRKRIPGAVLLLVGDGMYWEERQRDAERLGLADSARFLGRRSDVADLMQAMDVYLQPSRFEGLALTLVEAQIAGLPCLAGENLSPETKITPNLDFLPYETGAWVEAVARLATGYERRDCSGIAAAAGFSIGEQIREIEELYSGA